MSVPTGKDPAAELLHARKQYGALCPGALPLHPRHQHVPDIPLMRKRSPRPEIARREVYYTRHLFGLPYSAALLLSSGVK
jgi:hypothetical protein